MLRAASPHRNKKSLFDSVAVAVGLLSAVVSVVLITEPLPVDPMIYLEAALDPGSSPATHWSTRIGLVLPTSVIASVFGRSETTVYFVPVVFTALLATFTYLVARELFRSRSAAAGAALTVVTSPFALPYASQLLPDIGGAAFITGAMFLVLRSEHSARQDVFLAAAGVMVGMAYLVRETSLLAAPAVIAALILTRRTRKLWIPLIAALSVVIVEMSVDFFIWEDAFARINAFLGRSSQEIRGGAHAARIASTRQEHSNLISSMGHFVQLTVSRWHGWLVLPLAITGAVVGIVRGRRRAFILAAWILIPWLLLGAAGTITLASGKGLIRLTLDRYWIVIFAPVTVAAYGCLIEILDSIRIPSRRNAFLRFSSVLLSATLISGGIAYSLSERPDWFSRLSDGEYWDLREVLTDQTAPSTIYVDETLTRLTTLFTRSPTGRVVYEGSVKAVQTHSIETLALGAWLLLDPDGTFNGDSPSASLFADPLSNFTPAIVQRENAWIILKASPGKSNHGTVIENWQYRGLDTTSTRRLQPVGGRIEVSPEERVFVFDDTAALTRPSEIEGLEVAPLELISIESDMVMDGGRVELTCNFFDEGGSRRQRRAWRPATGSGISTWFCLTPEGSGIWKVRPIFVFRGATSIEVHRARVRAWPVEIAGGH